MDGCTMNQTTLNEAFILLKTDNYWIYLFVDVMELVMSLVASVAVGFGLYVFISIPLFHRHLMQLIYLIAANFYGLLICRIYVMMYVLINSGINSTTINLFSCVSQLKLIEYARIGFIFGYFVALESVVIERFVAIYQLATYEKNNYSICIFISILFQLCGILIGIYILYYDLIDLIILTFIASAANIAQITFFQIAQNINQKMYNGSKKPKLGLYTLSERYQLSENVRTSIIMKRVVIMGFILNTICQLAIITSVVSQQRRLCQAAISLFNFTILIHSILFVVISMSNVIPWRRKSQKIIKAARIKLKINKVSENMPSPQILRTLSGDRMVFNVLEERDMYFKSLSDVWNRSF